MTLDEFKLSLVQKCWVYLMTKKCYIYTVPLSYEIMNMLNESMRKALEKGWLKEIVGFTITFNQGIIEVSFDPFLENVWVGEPWWAGEPLKFERWVPIELGRIPLVYSREDVLDG